jgi:hypothetical protein
MLLIVPAVFAEGPYPLKNEIAVYVKKHDINNRLDKILAGINPESMEYNKQGYFAYEKKDWAQAAALFKKAIEIDGKNSFAHYNYACVLILQNRGPEPKEVLLDACQHLQFAADLDPYWALWMFHDPDLDSVRETGYQKSEYFPGGDCAPATNTEWGADGSISVSFHWDDSTYMGEPSVDGGHAGPPGGMPDGHGYRGFYCTVGILFITYYPVIVDRWSGEVTEEDVLQYSLGK